MAMIRFFRDEPSSVDRSGLTGDPEQGTHSELMRLAGRYAELFTLQASAYVD